MTHHYLLVIVPFLLLWGHLTAGNVEHEHINKRLKSQDQPDEKGSTRTNPMSLDFLIHSSDDQEPRSKLSYSPEKNPELVYPQRHSGKRKQLDCDISPESDQATSHCAQFGSIHSSESNLYSNDQPQSSSVPGSPSRVGYHHSHTNQALLDSEILEQSNKLKEQRSNLSREMHLFLVEQYTLPGIVRPRSKKLRGHWLDLLLGEYYTSGNSKLKEEVQRILTGPVQEGLGDKFPSNILRLEYMELQNPATIHDAASTMR
ncbi:hypothetical protein IWQ62_003745 [Dispira parvispora]|uniref:Uncharacterized protein n=1 Tax=Dispira parvispora TaxID=1520584 RepID=A0A9W8ANS9_9FUNG|nr:hypothetical protein IWQ62_003745 [Dispira parvispora]